MREYDPPHLGVGHLHVVVQWLHIGGDPPSVGIKGFTESVALKEGTANGKK